MKEKLELIKSEKSDIKVEDYENLFVGLEFEFNETQLINSNDVAKHFGLSRVGKTNGRQKKNKEVTLVDGNSFEIPIEIDMYKENELVADFYRDGSVDWELVTRPVSLKKLVDVKAEVFDYIKNELKGDLICSGKAGLHMTFLLDPHKERSVWNKTVVQNLIQYARAYYKEIIQIGMTGNNSRPTKYRHIPNADNMNYLDTEHYSAISLRKDENGIWGVEVRFPDGCDNWEKILKVIKFWMAMIRHCAVISKFGRMSFEQKIWEEQKSFSQKHVVFLIRKKKEKRISELVRQLKNSMVYYGIEVKKERIVNKELLVEDKLVEKVWDGVLEGKSYAELIKGLMAEGYERSKVFEALKEVGGR